MKPGSILATLCAMTACCIAHDTSSSSFAEKVSGRGAVQITGWAKLQGELMIYSDRKSMDTALKFPHCISGVFNNQAEMNLSEYDGKRVSITGILYEYSNLSDENRPLLQRKMLGHSVVPNFCFGLNVLLIKTITLASDSHATKPHS
jgi:hypothetical protein